MPPETLPVPARPLTRPAVSRETEARLDLYDILLNKWQAKINLVSPATLATARTRHFDDSLQLVPLIPADAKILYDLGSGAGFPGLVLAMARPDLSVHLLEVDQRKSAFLKTVSRETDTPVTVHTVRIDKIILPAPDVITARALASLTELLAMTERWWTEYPDCVLIFPKGSSYEAELEEAQVKYAFSLDVHTSLTDPKARVLVLSGVRNRL